MKEIKNTYLREADACLPADVFFSDQHKRGGSFKRLEAGFTGGPGKKGSPNVFL